MSESLALTRVSTIHLQFAPESQKHWEILFSLFVTPVLQLPKRILFSFKPPTDCNCHYLFTDYLGPTLSILILLALLQFSIVQNAAKKNLADIKKPTFYYVLQILIPYYILLSLFVYISSRLVKSRVRLFEISTLIGYSFYGYIITLGVPLFFEKFGDNFFFLLLIIFSGLSCVRILLILVFSIDSPIFRFIICCFIGNIHFLFVVYLYYHFINLKPRE